MEHEPCPFCGSEDVCTGPDMNLIENPDDWAPTGYVVCPDCGAVGPTAMAETFGEAEAIAWELWDAWGEKHGA